MYKPAKIDFTDKQIKTMAAGKPVRIAHSQLCKGGKVIMLHPANHMKVSKAFQAGRGCNLEVAPGEILATHSSDMEGTGFFGDLWHGIKKVFGVLKDSGALSAMADMAVAPVSAMTGQPALTVATRKLLKDTTGVGIKRPRISRKHNSLMGGSMRLPSE